MRGVYILHFHESCPPIRPQFGGPQHYVGISNNISYRLGQHRKGKGSAATQSVVKAGYKFRVGAIITVEPEREAEQFYSENVLDYCKICNEIAAMSTKELAPF